MRSRTYFLDDKRINSDDCYGFVSTARKTHHCVVGNHDILKGERLVRFNSPFMNDPICIKHALQDWDSGEGVILGVKIITSKWIGGSTRVECERFYLADIPSNNGQEDRQ